MLSTFLECLFKHVARAANQVANFSSEDACLPIGQVLRSFLPIYSTLLLLMYSLLQFLNNEIAQFSHVYINESILLSKTSFLFIFFFFTPNAASQPNTTKKQENFNMRIFNVNWYLLCKEHQERYRLHNVSRNQVQWCHLRYSHWKEFRLKIGRGRANAGPIYHKL